MACKDILMLLLAIAPNHVQLAPGSLRSGAIPEILKLGEELQAAAKQIIDGWEDLTNRAINAMEQRVMTNAGGATSHSAHPALVIVPGETNEDREERCIEALLTLRRGTEYFGQALPHKVYTVLAENLQRGSFRDLLLRHPELFQVNGDPANWSFQVRITAGVQP